MADRHLIKKIETATTCKELDSIRNAFKARGDEMPGPDVAALARRRVQLARAGQ